MKNQHPKIATNDFLVDMRASPDDRIAAVVDHFLKQGKPPTTRQVTTMAGVSNSGLKEKLPRIIQAVREEHRALAATPDAPAAISEAFARLWQAAWQAADAAFDARRGELAKQVLEANAEAEGNFDELCELEKARDNAMAELSATVAVNEATQAELAETKATLAEEEVKLSTAQARLEERESILHGQLQEAKQGEKVSAKRIADLEKALAAAEVAGEKLERELDTVKAELSASQTKLGEAQTQIETMSKNATDATALRSELEHARGELVKERATSADQEKALLQTAARLEESQRVIDQLGVTAKASGPKGTRQKAPSGYRAGEDEDDPTLHLPFSVKADGGAKAQPS